jgi:trans-aconitate 2-methyltransferase
MPTWDASQYLRFSEERTRPCRDLVARIPLDAPQTIVDLGCGPGNSTSVLAERWPEARLQGIDSSPEMIARARSDNPQSAWQQADIAAWRADQPVDLIFSNAALHWLPSHERLFPHLLNQVAPGGALAVQMPADGDAPAHMTMHAVATGPRWKGRFSGDIRTWSVQTPAAYYDMLAPAASRVEIWLTDYVHVLPDVAAIAEWYRGSGMRPYLDALSSEDERAQFIADVIAELARVFEPRVDGCVLFPFRRMFLVAVRQS